VHLLQDHPGGNALLRDFEDDATLAFMDHNPGNTGHALAIPKFHTLIFGGP